MRRKAATFLGVGVILLAIGVMWLLAGRDTASSAAGLALSVDHIAASSVSHVDGPPPTSSAKQGGRSSFVPLDGSESFRLEDGINEKGCVVATTSAVSGGPADGSGGGVMITNRAIFNTGYPELCESCDTFSNSATIDVAGQAVVPEGVHRLSLRLEVVEGHLPEGLTAIVHRSDGSTLASLPSPPDPSGVTTLSTAFAVTPGETLAWLVSTRASCPGSDCLGREGRGQSGGDLRLSLSPDWAGVAFWPEGPFLGRLALKR